VKVATIPQEDFNHEEHQLYNGEVILRYSPKAHRYSVVVRGRTYQVPSVTTVLGVLDKPALIPWAINQTIDLIRPAIQPYVEHSESYLEEVYTQAKRAARTKRDVAADIGTLAHTILERYPDCGTIPDGDVGSCVAGGLAWLRTAEVQIEKRECPVYSRRHRFSGRFDGLARVNGSLSLFDWKTSTGVYPEYRLQLAAYVAALEEEDPSIHIEQRIVLHLSKEDGSFTPHIYPRASLRQDLNAFLAALRLHRRLKAIAQEEKLSRKQSKDGQI
jgi:hypothetical protein